MRLQPSPSASSRPSISLAGPAGAAAGLVAAAILGAFAVGSATAAPETRLTGTVGPGFTITLTGASGKPVTSLPVGRYAITVRDQSPIHDFHLIGPGTGKATSVTGTGPTVWHLVLRKGSYRFVCDPHAQFMHGSFVVR